MTETAQDVGVGPKVARLKTRPIRDTHRAVDALGTGTQRQTTASVFSVGSNGGVVANNMTPEDSHAIGDNRCFNDEAT